MEFKPGLVEKSYRPGACVAHLARILDVNYFGRRIDSAFLFPDTHCCPTKIVTLVE